MVGDSLNALKANYRDMQAQIQQAQYAGRSSKRADMGRIQPVLGMPAAPIPGDRLRSSAFA